MIEEVYNKSHFEQREKKAKEIDKLNWEGRLRSDTKIFTLHDRTKDSKKFMKKLRGLRKHGEKSIRSGEQSSSKDAEGSISTNNEITSSIRKNSIEKVASLPKKEKSIASTVIAYSIGAVDSKEDNRRSSTYSFAQNPNG